MSKFLPFEEALAMAQSLNLANQFEWEQWCKEGIRPPNVPANPRKVYKDGGWHGWGHWLGTGNVQLGVANRFLSFAEALAVAQSLGLVNRFEWREWCKEGMRPPKVPADPSSTYKDGGWQGWGHWLGTGNTQRGTEQFLPFDEALAAARSLKLASQYEWNVWSREGLRPPNVPSNPHHTYKDGGWQGWVHWLGSRGLKKASKFVPFAQALTFARSLDLANRTEWEAWCKEGRRPPNVPSHPSRTYKDGGWQGWGHWLGTGNQHTKQVLPFAEALAVARSLGLASRFEWEQWCKEGTRPPNVPSVPNRTYKDGGWQGWVHWLGSGGIKKASKFAPFAQALTFARSLNLASQKEWKMWCKEGRRPPNVPSTPGATYKDGGWQGWGHWLGTGSQSNTAKNEQFLPFDEALRVARHLRLVSQKEWRLWCRTGARPANMPAAPDKAYVHDGWMGWTHWLYHANLGAATAPTSARPCSKRAAATSTGTASGKSMGKRQRR